MSLYWVSLAFGLNSAGWLVPNSCFFRFLGDCAFYRMDLPSDGFCIVENGAEFGCSMGPVVCSSFGSSRFSREFDLFFYPDASPGTAFDAGTGLNPGMAEMPGGELRVPPKFYAPERGFWLVAKFFRLKLGAFSGSLTWVSLTGSSVCF